MAKLFNMTPPGRRCWRYTHYGQKDWQRDVQQQLLLLSARDDDVIFGPHARVDRSDERRKKLQARVLSVRPIGHTVVPKRKRYTAEDKPTVRLCSHPVCSVWATKRLCSLASCRYLLASPDSSLAGRSSAQENGHSNPGVSPSDLIVTNSYCYSENFFSPHQTFLDRAVINYLSSS